MNVFLRKFDNFIVVISNIMDNAILNSISMYL